MQTITADTYPHDDVLLNENGIIITSARLEIEKTSYAMKYMSAVSFSESHPPRSEARVALFACVLALLALCVYLILGKVTVYAFIALGLIALGGGLIAAFVLWVNPSNYELAVAMINGEKIQITSQSEPFIHRVHQAMTTGIALNRQDPMVQEHPPLFTRAGRGVRG
ncbi:MAG: hypothetical protein KTR33_14495 [Gammaproteobacteria bacterium]|nr:hypothetical protein [Gammaproteobacteria bacterium]